MPVRFPKENNPLYPLPPDYYKLSEEDQRRARLNAITLQETPEDLVVAWSFFRKWYLEPREAQWYKRWKPSPPLHYLMVRDIGEHELNAWAAPRAFAKTTVIREIAMFLMLTRPRFSITLVQSTDRKCSKSLAILKRQFEVNPLLKADFGVLRGKKGQRPWNTDLLELPNGSMIEGLSVRSTALRGERPDMLIIDDPEYDDDESNNPGQLLEDFEKMLFKVLLPMMEEGTSTFWIGTLINRHSFLWHLSQGQDERFSKLWNRRTIRIVMPDGSYAWENKWGSAEIEALRTKLGDSAFNSEMMNNPGAGSQRVFKIHPRLCTYAVSGSPETDRDPLSSDAAIRFDVGVKKDNGEIEYNEESHHFGDYVTAMHRLICVDWARKVTATSDYSCVMVMGFDQQDTLWVLDGFVGKVPEDKVIEVTWDLAQKWQVRSIGAESTSVQEHMVDRMAAKIATWSAGRLVVPRIFPINYVKRNLRGDYTSTRMSKPERIAGLDWRFRQYRIRLPEHRKHEQVIKDLYYQIEHFTMDLSLLQHDDVIDTLAMHQHMVRRQGASRSHEVSAVQSARERLLAGEYFDEETGLLHAHALQPGELTMDLVRDVMTNRLGEVKERDLCLR